jgi:predicted ABC-type transport system involved in lysophospholipase L1 biosynthesis ATPase subunit
MTPDTQRGQISFVFAPDGRVPEATGLPSGAGCVVPVGAPLFEHRSAIHNVVLLTSLSGRRCDRATAVYWLRRVDVPDALHESAAASLPAMCRLSVWLAIVHLTEPEFVVLENPFGTLDSESTHSLIGLLVEASSRIRRVVVTGSDRSIAQRLSATVVGA